MTLQVAKKLGGCLNFQAFELVSDALLITVSGTVINLHEISTKTLIKSYEYHDFPVKSLAIFEDSSRNRELFSVDASGLIKCVALSTDVAIFAFHLRENVISALFCKKLKKLVYKPALSRDSLKLFDFFSKEIQSFRGDFPEKTTTFSEEEEFQGLALGSDESLLVEFQGKSLTIYGISSEISKKNAISHENLVTCVALRRDNSCLAVGDCLGKICLYWEPAKAGKSHASKFHWHCRPVLCLKFNEFSDILLSGGSEVNSLSF